jgi:hypothetical protein
MSKEKVVRFPSWFAILVGISMVAQWSLFLLSGNVPELRTEPVRIGFHLAAELLTALVLMVSGTGVLAAKRWARPLLLVGLGMLVYTSIVSPGYFAQRGEMGFVLMFGVVLALTGAAIVSVLKSSLKLS